MAVLYATDGADQIDGAFRGLTGDDTFVISASSQISQNDIVDLWSGRDTIEVRGSFQGALTFDLRSADYTNFERLWIRGEQTTVQVTAAKATSWINELVGDAGAQTLVINMTQLGSTFSMADRTVTSWSVEDRIIITGSGGDDTIRGFKGASNMIDGSFGVDQMIGGDFDDTFIVEDALDTVSGLGGRDVVHAYVNLTLSNDVEDLVLKGGAPLNGTGNDLANQLTGNAGANLLDGGAGNDVLKGLGGNDDYRVDSQGDQVIEAAGEGYDRVYASVSYRLAAGTSVERLATTNESATAALNLFGNEYAQDLVGNDGNNILDGGGGDDWMFGRKGNDTFWIDSANDLAFEAAGEGYDTIYTTTGYVLQGGTSIEKLAAADAGSTASLNLTGNEFSQDIYGNAGANILRGGGGDDWFFGGAGNDSYHIDSLNDVVFEQAGGGFDAVYSTLSMSLQAGSEIELLSAESLGSTTNINLSGNERSQEIWGNAGNNRLTSGGGADQLRGLGGNDSYVLSSGLEAIFEVAGGGTDAAYTSVSYRLAAGVSVETLSVHSLSSTSTINLVGNELDQDLWGNEGANLLDGGFGNDVLRGGGGADIFQFSTSLSGSGNVDRIIDFKTAIDKIQLVGGNSSDFGGLPIGQLQANYFSVVGSGAQDGMVIYNPNTGQLFYDRDGSLPSAPIQFALLDPGLALTAAHFTVVTPSNTSAPNSAFMQVGASAFEDVPDLSSAAGIIGMGQPGLDPHFTSVF